MENNSSSIFLEKFSNTNRNSLFESSFILDMLLAKTGNFYIKSDEFQKEPFLIKKTKLDKKNYSRNIFAVKNGKIVPNQKTEAISNFRIELIIGPSFDLIKDLALLNNKIEEFSEAEINNNPLEKYLKIDLNKKISEYWYFQSVFLLDYAKKTNFGELNEVQNALIDFSKTLMFISDQFSKDKKEINQENKLYRYDWLKTETKLNILLKKIKYKKNKPNFDQLIQRLVLMSSAEAKNKIYEKLSNQAREGIFSFLEKDLLRKSGIFNILERIDQKDDYLDILKHKSKNNEKKQIILTLISKEFPKDQKEMENIGLKIFELKNKLKKENNTNLKDTLIKDISNLQMNLAKKIFSIVYSEKFFLYQKDKRNFKDIENDQLVNCVSRGLLIKAMLEAYSDEIVFASRERDHFIPYIILENKKTLRIDSDFGFFEENSREVISKGNFYDIYQASNLYAIAIKYKDSAQSKIRLSPKEASEELKMAEEIVRESIKMDPDNTDGWSLLAKIIKNDASRMEEYEMLLNYCNKKRPFDCYYIYDLLALYVNRKNKDKVLYYNKKLRSEINNHSPFWDQIDINTLDNYVKPFLS